MHTEDNYGGTWMLADNRFGSLDTVQNRHAHVHHYHIWFERGGEFDRFPTVLTFAYNLQVGLALKQRAQPGTHDNVVVGQQYPQFLHELNSPDQRMRSGAADPPAGAC